MFFFSFDSCNAVEAKSFVTQNTNKIFFSKQTFDGNGILLPGAKIANRIKRYELKHPSSYLKSILIRTIPPAPCEDIDDSPSVLSSGSQHHRPGVARLFCLWANIQQINSTMGHNNFFYLMLSPKYLNLR